MKSFFKDDVIQGVEQVFKDLNEVYKFDSKLVDSDIQYREKYTNLIMDFISYKEFEEILPSFNSFYSKTYAKMVLLCSRLFYLIWTSI
ncbi:MAG: hypothetical protein L6V95_08095 [Candidatus Melainabacteria bacterium]|nr:MAG: hypothetical protein L6V95_08095 [Candidatus Melainabacteria bacterium]